MPQEVGDVNLYQLNLKHKKMKKIIFIVLAVVSIGLVSCASSSQVDCPAQKNMHHPVK